jgi:predicted DNA binding CopG/RHH family protein
MNKLEQYTADADQWDSGELGQELAHAKRSDQKHEIALDDAMGLQMISIRLQKKMIEDLKMIGMAHGVGYQPLIRDILSRFIDHEIKQIQRDTIERLQLEAAKMLEKEKEKEKEKEIAAKPKQRKAA